MFTARMINEMLSGIGQTLYMTLFSTFLAYVLGLPIGVALYVTDKNGLKPCKPVNTVLGAIVNIVRSVPFIILLITVLPFTMWLLGTTLGPTATVVPLVISAAPFIGRMVESSLKEVPYGVIEAAKAMGTPTFRIIVKTLIPEAKPSLISGCTITVTTILGYTAMAGYVGGGGLGAIAINYGYYRYNTPVMLVTVALMVIIVQLFQTIGSYIAIMGGVDAIAFAGGVGEHCERMRRMILSGLEPLGIILDHKANRAESVESIISDPRSKVKVLIVPTNEELMIARDTAKLVNGEEL